MKKLAEKTHRLTLDIYTSQWLALDEESHVRHVPMSHIAREMLDKRYKLKRNHVKKQTDSV